MEEGINTEAEPKPKVLYHASPNRNLQTIEPRRESVRDKDEGPVVFATHDEACATLFLVNTSDSWTFKGRINGIHHHIISDRKRFEEMDKGGSIYEVPSDDFERKINHGWQSLEWTSTKPVNPIRKTDYSSGLDAMIDKGVQVYFVDKETFDQRLKNRGRRNFDFLKTLISENQKRKIN